MAKETPANPGRFERSVQDIVEPVIPGPSEHREPLVEIASPYHIEADEENTSDTMERSSKHATPYSLHEHSDSETDASVALQSSSSVSTGDEWRRGGGGDDGGESGDDAHERERELEREWEDELARRAGVPR